MSHYALTSDIKSKLKEIIKIKFGSLDDLPKELSNTILNVYYKMIVSNEQHRNKKGAWLPREVTTSDNVLGGYVEYLEKQSRDSATFEYLPQMIEQIRSMPRQDAMERNIYIYLCDLTLDIFKYNIKDADKKSGLRRIIERKFSKVDEISNLIDLVDI